MSAETDCLRLVIGDLPASAHTSQRKLDSFPVSPHYAKMLAELAHLHGFDGYLLNFECPLRGGVEQSRALCGWIHLLKQYLHSPQYVGPHAQVIWYDSVIISGDLRWQDRVNALNLPFFKASSGFFSNYTWHHSAPLEMTNYILSLKTSHKLNNIYTGIDVWGRGSHGGGGFGCYKALEHIDPVSLGLSVALFGQAWTWESQQGEPGWDWQKWWRRERVLWHGPNSSDDLDKSMIVIPSPDISRPPENCTHGSFKPVASFWPRDKNGLITTWSQFFTSFSPGVGVAWFVRGKKVHEGRWTDLDKCTSLGDLCWPCPPVCWENDPVQLLPRIFSQITMDDAWIGGSALSLEIKSATNDQEFEVFFDCLWLPIQRIAMHSCDQHQSSFRAQLIYKLKNSAYCDVDIGLLLTKAGKSVDVITSHTDKLPNGWTSVETTGSLSGDVSSNVYELGLRCAMAVEDPHFGAQILVGGLSFHQIEDPLVRPRLTWAQYNHEESGGMLTWDVASHISQEALHVPTSADDPEPAWTTLSQLTKTIPRFLYANIYALNLGVRPYDPNLATWLTTTGLDISENQAWIDNGVRAGFTGSVRLFVQGVTMSGSVLDWDDCAFVDVELPSVLH